jgi:hypothetical protein
MDNPDGLKASVKEDLKKLAESKHCFFCSKLWKNILNFYAHLPHDLIIDANKRREYGQEGALCPFHLWQLASMASSASLSLLFAEMAEEISRRLHARMSCDQKSENSPEEHVHSHRSCLVCSHAGQVEMHYRDYFRKMLAEPEGSAAFAKSNGFCLRHALLIADGLEEEYSNFVLGHSVVRFSELSNNLQNFSQKTKMYRRDLIQPDEQNAVSRALIQLGGIRYLHYLL